jgi:hypothetical protein
MDDLQSNYGQQLPNEAWRHTLANVHYTVEDLVRRVEHVEQQLASLQIQNRSMKRSPNLALRIFLYSAGILLVFMAVVLLLQSFGILTSISRATIWALVLLAIGSGILAGMRSR